MMSNYLAKCIAFSKSNDDSFEQAVQRKSGHTLVTPPNTLQPSVQILAIFFFAECNSLVKVSSRFNPREMSTLIVLRVKVTVCPF